MRTNKKYQPSTKVIQFVDYVLEYLHVLTGKDWDNVFVDELKAKGEPITMASAYKEIMDKSRSEGISIGEERERRETATKMLAGGKLSIQDIAEYSDLSVEEVRKLSRKK